MTSSTQEPAQGTLERMGLTALGYPPFVTFFSANLTSNASWFIFGAALNTYILQVTGSAQDVGFASFIYSLPFALFMLHAGLLADRFGAKRDGRALAGGRRPGDLATGLLALGGLAAVGPGRARVRDVDVPDARRPGVHLDRQ